MSVTAVRDDLQLLVVSKMFCSKLVSLLLNITYWGAVRPQMRSRPVIAGLMAAEQLIARTRAVRYLGSFKLFVTKKSIVPRLELSANG